MNCWLGTFYTSGWYSAFK